MEWIWMYFSVSGFGAYVFFYLNTPDVQDKLHLEANMNDFPL